MSGDVEIPLVCFDADILRILGIKQTTLKKLRRQRAFPIPELAALDKRHRYGRADVLAYLNREYRRPDGRREETNRQTKKWPVTRQREAGQRCS